MPSKISQIRGEVRSEALSELLAGRKSSSKDDERAQPQKQSKSGRLSYPVGTRHWTDEPWQFGRVEGVHSPLSFEESESRPGTTVGHGLLKMTRVQRDILRLIEKMPERIQEAQSREISRPEDASVGVGMWTGPGSNACSPQASISAATHQLVPEMGMAEREIENAEWNWRKSRAKVG